MHGEEGFYSREQKLQPRPPRRGQLLIIGLVFAIGILIGAVGSQLLHSFQQPATTLGITPTTEPPTAVPSTIPTTQVIQINQTMTIIRPQAAESFFSLIVKTATIDPARMQMMLLIGLQNNGTSAVGEHLNYLRFQDQITGDTKDGAGEGFTNIDFAPGQTILFRPTFPFTPVAGRTYQLSAQLGDFYDFSPITIKF